MYSTRLSVKVIFQCSYKFCVAVRHTDKPSIGFLQYRSTDVRFQLQHDVVFYVDSMLRSTIVLTYTQVVRSFGGQIPCQQNTRQSTWTQLSDIILSVQWSPTKHAGLTKDGIEENCARSDFDIVSLTSLAMLGSTLREYVVGSLKRVLTSTLPCLAPISISIWANTWNPSPFAMLSGRKSTADIRTVFLFYSATVALGTVVTFGEADLVKPAVFQLNGGIFGSIRVLLAAGPDCPISQLCFLRVWVPSLALNTYTFLQALHATKSLMNPSRWLILPKSCHMSLFSSFLVHHNCLTFRQPFLNVCLLDGGRSWQHCCRFIFCRLYIK